jgi:peptidoglycan hydrolase-like protein with peptidoglycan-binding domain
MIRKLALVAGFLFAAVSASTLTAQTAAGSKPGPRTATMQHRQDSTSVRASAGARTHHVRWTRDQIMEAQQGLAKAGFYQGKPTGNFDRSTRKAIRKYQKANKLPVTGRLDNDLLTRLHSS